VAQSLDKLQHSQRQEAAKQRREEKKKLEKERMMNETDPEKTRKWEVRRHVTTGRKYRIVENFSHGAKFRVFRG
jgi:hypothetical protein